MGVLSINQVPSLIFALLLSAGTLVAIETRHLGAVGVIFWDMFDGKAC